MKTHYTIEEQREQNETLALMLIGWPGYEWNTYEIAEMIGISACGVHLIERRALRKIILAFDRSGICKASDACLTRRRPVRYRYQR